MSSYRSQVHLSLCHHWGHLQFKIFSARCQAFLAPPTPQAVETPSVSAPPMPTVPHHPLPPPPPARGTTPPLLHTALLPQTEDFPSTKLWMEIVKTNLQ